MLLVQGRDNAFVGFVPDVDDLCAVDARVRKGIDYIECLGCIL